MSRMENILKTLPVVLLSAMLFCSCGNGNKRSAVERKTALDTLVRNGEKSLEEGLYIESLRNYLTFIRQTEEDTTVEASLKAKAYLRIGGIHLMYNDYSTAISYFKKGLTYCHANREKETKEKLLTNMVSAYYLEDSLEMAQQYNRKALAEAVCPKDTFFNIYNDGLIAYKRKGNAKECMLRAMEFGQLRNLPQAVFSYPLEGISRCFEDEGRIDSALHYEEAALACAKTSEGYYDSFLLQKVYENLTRLHALNGNNREVLSCQEKYQAISDSILNIGMFLQLKNVYNENDRQQWNEKVFGLNKTVNYQRSTILVFVLIILTCLVSLFIIWRQRKTLRESYMALYERNKELVALEKKYHDLSEKDTKPAEAVGSVEDGESCPQEEAAPSGEGLWEKVVEFMESSEAIYSPEFSLAVLAKAIGSNTSYTSSVINHTGGTNFRSLLNEYRIREARKRIMAAEYANYTLQSLGESVGYQSKTTFFSAFKNITGMSPAAYRRFLQTDKGVAV